MPTSAAEGPGTGDPASEGRERTPTAAAGDPASEGRERGAHLSVRGLTAGYGGLPVIRDVTVCVGRGEVVSVIGPNGAGKSTLLKAVVSVLQPMAGEVTLGGRRLDGLRADRVARRGVGYVPQVRDVFEPLTVRENLEMGGYRLPRRAVAERIDEVTAAFPQLAPMLGRPAGNLSGGERKMVAIGRVLMMGPSLVLLDEPTAGLAPQLADRMLSDYVGALAARGVAVLLVEQRAREALTISDFAYVMAAGVVVIAAPAADILARGDLGDVFLGRGASARPR
jgi:ABC-type branched-subunit amino acid transport system ATPase component